MAKKTSAAKKRDTLRVLIVEARYYEHIADALLTGATRVLDEAGANTTAWRCPARSSNTRVAPASSASAIWS